MVDSIADVLESEPQIGDHERIDDGQDKQDADEPEQDRLRTDLDDSWRRFGTTVIIRIVVVVLLIVAVVDIFLIVNMPLVRFVFPLHHRLTPSSID